MKQIVILTFSLFATSAVFAATNDTNDHPTNTNKTKKGGGESEEKVKEAHKKVSLVNLAAFSLTKEDTLSSISPFGNMDRFRKATADYSEFPKK